MQAIELFGAARTIVEFAPQKEVLIAFTVFRGVPVISGIRAINC
jgi:hypothetical protein